MGVLSQRTMIDTDMQGSSKSALSFSMLHPASFHRLWTIYMLLQTVQSYSTSLTSWRRTCYPAGHPEVNGPMPPPVHDTFWSTLSSHSIKVDGRQVMVLSMVIFFRIQRGWLSFELTDMNEVRLCPMSAQASKANSLLLTYVSGGITRTLVDGNETEYCHEDTEGYVGSGVRRQGGMHCSGQKS